MDGRGKEGTFIYERIGRVKHVLDWLGRVSSGCQKQTCGTGCGVVCRVQARLLDHPREVLRAGGQGPRGEVSQCSVCSDDRGSNDIGCAVVPPNPAWRRLTPRRSSYSLLTAVGEALRVHLRVSENTLVAARSPSHRVIPHTGCAFGTRTTVTGANPFCPVEACKVTRVGRTAGRHLACSYRHACRASSTSQGLLPSLCMWCTWSCADSRTCSSGRAAGSWAAGCRGVCTASRLGMSAACWSSAWTAPAKQVRARVTAFQCRKGAFRVWTGDVC